MDTFCTQLESAGDVRGDRGHTVTMKSVWVPVLLLIASVHLFTPGRTVTYADYSSMKFNVFLQKKKLTIKVCFLKRDRKEKKRKLNLTSVTPLICDH